MALADDEVKFVLAFDGRNGFPCPIFVAL